jgi:chemotaxis protein MotB
MSARKGRGRRGGEHEEHVNHERWLISYADMITLLMALFVVMWSMANVNTTKYEALSISLKEAFSGRILDGGERVLRPGNQQSSEQPAPEPPFPAITPVTESSQGDGRRSDAAEREAEDLRKLERAVNEWAEMRGLQHEVQARVARRGLTIRILTDRILFASGSAELKPESSRLLDALSRLLKTQVRNPIQIEGNTDNVPVSGRFPTNWELSTTRATTVVRALIARGVGPGRLAAAGYADRNPIATNATEAGRRRNRRVELVVLRTGGHGGQAGTQGGPGS